MPKFLLVRWVEDESTSVLPGSSARPGQEVYAGAFGEFKWAGKYYDGEVLSTSGG